MNENIKYLEESINKLKSIDKLINRVLSEEEEGMWKKYVAQPIAGAWSYFVDKVRSMINTIISRTLSLLKFPGDLTTITIPAQKKPPMVDALKEGALQAIKGNYNEALTCKYIADNNKVPIKITIISENKELNEVSEDEGTVVVYLSSDGHREVSTIQNIVSQWDNKLKEEAKGNYNELFKIIDMGSRDMTQYIMETTLKDDGLITAVKLKNLSFLKGAEFKGDMELTIEKAGREIIRNYSLKLQQGLTVNLWNTTAVKMLEDLVGKEARIKAEIEFEKDTEYNAYFHNAKESAEELKMAKRIYSNKNKDKSIDDIFKQSRYNFSDHQFKTKLKNIVKTNRLKDFIEIKREERGFYRGDVNLIVAKIIYKVLNSYFNDPKYKALILDNLLKHIGFNDKDTRFLMAIVGNAELKRGKCTILDRHPELNLKDSTLVYSGGVSIKIVGPTGKTLLSIDIKEGEQRIVSTKVNFKDIEPHKLGGKE